MLSEQMKIGQIGQKYSSAMKVNLIWLVLTAINMSDSIKLQDGFPSVWGKKSLHLEIVADVLWCWLLADPFSYARSSHGAMVNVLVYNIIVNNFELQSCYYINLWTNTFGKVRTHYLPSYGLNSTNCWINLALIVDTYSRVL